MKNKNTKIVWYRKDIAARISQVRNKLGLTLKGFGKQFSNPVNAGVVQKWERGTNLPNDEHLFEIAKIGNISINWLMYGSDFENFQNHLLPQVFQKFESLESQLRDNNINDTQAIEISNSLVELLNSLNLESFIGNQEITTELLDSKYRLQYVMETVLSNEPTELEIMKFNNLFNLLTLFLTAKVKTPDTYEDNIEIIDSLLWLSGNHPEEVYKDNQVFKRIVDSDGLEKYIDKVTSSLHENIDNLSRKLKNKYL